MDDGVSRIAGHVKNPETGAQFQSFVSQLLAVLTGHDNIREHEIDWPLRVREDDFSRFCIRASDDLVA